jgi:hypothetical protein
MAKKPTFDAWLEDTKKGLETDEQQKALDLLVSSEKVKNNIFGGYLRESDYYRKVNDFNEAKVRLDTEESAFKAQKEQWTSWYQDAQTEYSQALKDKEELERKLKYETIEDEPTGKVDSRFKTELEELRKKVEIAESRTNVLDQSSTRLIVDMTKIMADAMKNGYSVDPDDVMNYSINNKVDPYSAYERITRDERLERFEADEKKKLAAAREEGYKEAMQKTGSSPDRLPRGGPSTLEFFTGSTPVNLGNQNDRLAAASQAYLKMEQAKT